MARLQYVNRETIPEGRSDLFDRLVAERGPNPENIFLGLDRRRGWHPFFLVYPCQYGARWCVFRGIPFKPHFPPGGSASRRRGL